MKGVQGESELAQASREWRGEQSTEHSRLELIKREQNVESEEKGCFISKSIDVRKSLAQEQNQTNREISKMR